MASESHATVTILFTDLVESTDVLTRTGDERAQRIFRVHHELFAELVGKHGGNEVKWTGDGLMCAFPSVTLALRCALEMQRRSQSRVEGERLQVRVGLNVGDALRDESDYFGTPVVVARRLCDKATAGQVICSGLVVGLLAGRTEFQFRDLGPLELKGIPQPLPAFEVRWEEIAQRTSLIDDEFVGRDDELERLGAHLDRAIDGRGGLVMLTGEPGIGKTTTAAELTERAKSRGATILWGRCIEGDWAPPYAPFAEAMTHWTSKASADDLADVAKYAGGALIRLVPRLAEREPVALGPEEERVRLFDAVLHAFELIARATPVVCVLDDLHWADKGTIALLRHVVRFAANDRILFVGAYRDVELDRTHPLAEALGSLRRDTTYERVKLDGLDENGVRDFLEILARQKAPDFFVRTLTKETDGNPFYMRAVLSQLVDENKIYQDDAGRWTTGVDDVASLGIPEGVREAIGRRLSRLSEAANALLHACCAFETEFRFDVAAEVAEMDERAALNALDEILAARHLEPGRSADTYVFHHALVRHTLYSELNPSRQVRLHRQLAEALERVCGDDPTPAQSGEIASQYQRSAVLPGAERGVTQADRAAAHAEATGAHAEAVKFLRTALELAPLDDVRRPRLTGRLGIALSYASESDGSMRDEALNTLLEALRQLAEAEGDAAAARFAAIASGASWFVADVKSAWALSREGLRYAGDRHDTAWAALMYHDLERRQAEDPRDPGIPLDSPERREAGGILLDQWNSTPVTEIDVFSLDEPSGPPAGYPYASREDVLASPANPFWMLYAGEYAGALPKLLEQHRWLVARGQITGTVYWCTWIASCYTCLGDFDQARRWVAEAETLADRLGGTSPHRASIGRCRIELCEATGEGWSGFMDTMSAGATAILADPANRFHLAAILVSAGFISAQLGWVEGALSQLERVLPAIDDAPAWAINYTAVVCRAADTLWTIERTDHLESIERGLREKVLPADFRYPMLSPRLSLARVCALIGRFDEAHDWFEDGRRRLEESGERPLRAVADYDEALMNVRRNEPELARPFLKAAREQFEALEMTGWITRADELAVR